MKSLASFLAAVCIFVVTFASYGYAGDGWIEDFAQAKKIAKEQNKQILADFTGSNWCEPCMEMEKTVFSRQAFLDYAKAKYVLLKVDFPQGPKGNAQNASVKEQNAMLAEKYGVEGFPTILILDASGKKKGELSYMEGGPTAFNAALAKIK